MHYNIIIVGGGLVGRCLAYALHQSQLRIALIDAIEHDRPDPRLIALNYGSVCFLNKIGVWQKLEQQATPIHDVHVSHRGRFGMTRLSRNSIKLPALGYVVRAQEMNEALQNRQGELFTNIRPAVVKGITHHEKSPSLTLQTSHKNTDPVNAKITSDLIIAADGTHSTIRTLLNFTTETIDYQQSAIVTTTSINRSHHHIAYERFLNDGVIAMLPLPGSQCATIWTAGHETISSLMQLTDKEFTHTLQTHFGYRLGRLQGMTQRSVFPLHFIRVKNPIKENVILLGNAAHTIHPIAAQGLNLALYEIAHLTPLLLTHFQKKQSLSHVLASYLIHSQNKANLLFSHYLNRLFSFDFWGIDFLRQLGMMSIDICPPIKRRLSRLLAMENLNLGRDHGLQT